MSSSVSPDDQVSTQSHDEFNPVRLFRVIYRRRLVFLLVFLGVVFAGVLAALQRTPLNSYVTTLQIGTTYGSNGNSGRLVEDTEGVATKLQHSVIPGLMNQANQPGMNDVPEVTVKTKKAAGIILLMSSAPEEMAGGVAALHETIVRQIIKEHEALVMGRYELILATTKSSLIKSQAEIQNLTITLSEQKQRRQLLEQQLRRLNADIQSLSATRQNFGKDPTANDAAAMYLLQTELPAMQQRRDKMEEDLNIRLDLEIAGIQQKLANADSAREAAEKKLALIQNELESQWMTRIETLAAVMPGNVGLTAKLIFIMSIVLGLLAAWFVVMFMEYLTLYNKRT